jgi:hypothetical protein
MKNIIALTTTKTNLRSIIFDLFALSFIYLVPTFSHLLSFPLYLIEPMRLMLIIALVHTTKRNAYLIAFSLPLFSFLISGHPMALKTGLISLELLLNVWLFFKFSEIIKNKFAPILISIVLSKVFYYAIKFAFISFALLSTNLISTPIYIQLITTFVFSSYLFLVLRRKGVVDSEN